MTDEFHARMIVRHLKDSIRSSPFARLCLGAMTPAEKEAMDARGAVVQAGVKYWENLIHKGGPDLRAALDAYASAMRRDEEDAIIARADALKAERASQSWS